MNPTITLHDPGAILGRTFLRIAQVILLIAALGCAYMAFLASEGLFSGLDIEFDSDFQEIFSTQSPDEILVWIFGGLAIKALFWCGVLFWLGKKI